jgi:hypothetical protein
MPDKCWKSYLRCAGLLGAAAILVVSSAHAQSMIATNESSSAAMQLASVGDGAGIGAAAAFGGSEEGAKSYARTSNWKSYAVKNLAFELGAGFNAPVGNDKPVITWGGNLNVGAGVHLNQYISLLAEYQFMDNKLPGGLIADAGAAGGHAHIWSFTLAPVIDLFPKRTNSMYVTGGGGFYRKVTSFTDPVEVIDCYYFCTTDTQNVVVSHFSSNQGGMNLGFGFTHRLGSSSDSKTKLFAEARYLFIDTPGINETNGLGTTELIPVTFGVRW